MSVELRDIRYRFPEAAVDALRNIGWHVGAGETALVVGPSGGGKSTLLRCLNGLIPHFHGGWYAGEATIFGNVVARSSPRDLAPITGSVFQDPESQTVSNHVIDEIVFTMEQLGVEPRTMRRQLEEVTTLLGIQHLLKRNIATLSGGERQIVALASAIAHQPRLVVLDEPTSQLDDDAAERFINTLIQLRHKTGLTSVIAEHRVERLAGIVDQTVAVANGTLDVAPGPQQFGPLATPPMSRDAGRTVLEIDNLSFAYDDRTILDSVTFRASSGEVIALRGPNGAGKTTLFKLLMGLLRPAAGQITVDGRSIDELGPADRAGQLGYVPQFPSSILHRETLREELQFTQRVQRREAALPDILERLGIAHHQDSHPLDLSGGERQRAAIAAIATTMPTVLLLDEPTRGLSREEQRLLVQFVRDYAASGRLVVLASHDQSVATAAADHLLTLSAGKLTESASSIISPQRT